MLEGADATAAAAAALLGALTLAIGRRFLIVDGVERWKDGEVAEHLAPALAAMPADTTVAFFAREEGRAKAPAALPPGGPRGRRGRRRRDGGQGVGSAGVGVGAAPPSSS